MWGRSDFSLIAATGESGRMQGATRPKAVDLEEGKGSTGEAETTATTGPAVEITKATAGGQTEKHFYGTMTLDPVRATLDFATVVDEVV